MQNNERKAFILIWSIFLSLVISISFISVSTKISKNIKNNSSFTENIKVDSEINVIVNSSSPSSTRLSNGEEIIFSDPSLFEYSLKNGKTIYLNSPVTSSIDIELSESSVIYFEASSSSGVIKESGTISGHSGSLLIKNLGGFTRITADSDNDFSKDIKNYKILKKVGNRTLIKNNFINF